VRKVCVGVVVGRVRVSNVLNVGAGYVEEDRVVSDRVRWSGKETMGECDATIALLGVLGLG
jgi:hypothetical protein